MTEEKESVNSLLMTDWAANARSIAKDAKTFIYELVLLSLVYDEILIQDEVFALSEKLSGWMENEENFRQLQSCFSVGCIHILTHPKNGFRSKKLQDLSEYNPIKARANHIAKYSSYEDRPFKPTDQQKRFYNKIDTLISCSNDIRRPVGIKNRLNFRLHFPKILQEVLCNGLYRNWISKSFVHITREMAADFIDFIDKPEKALGKLPPDMRQSDQNKDVIFSRSLGYRLARYFYPPKERKAIQRLIQTAFAAPFCENEDASGRYDRNLKELIWSPREMESTLFDENENVCSLQAHVQVPLNLPSLGDNLSEIISEVRNSPEGLSLRRAMKEHDFNSFEKQRLAWQAVADKLAHLLNKSKKINVKIAAIQIGKDIITGVVVGGLFEFSYRGNIDLPVALGSAFLGGSIGLANHTLRLFWQDVRSQNLRPLIEKAVQIRCSRIPCIFPSAFNLGTPY